MDNPVDWYPWGDEAFARARAEHKPVLLSVGYAACHWCHVMAHESFEDATIAAVMNEQFINVKVDREERPDVDAIYMRAVQALTQHGGWPMTVFLTPDGAPFFGGTYFPPDDRHGMPSFRRVLTSVAHAWQTQRDDLLRTSEQLLQIYVEPGNDDAPIDSPLLERATGQVMAQYDRVHGGFGVAPKFPPTMVLDFLLRRWARTGDRAVLTTVARTWESMVRGGIYDQLGGGFHRYAVDSQWLVPHFEKMLYDNALLVRLGAHLWQATGDPSVREVTEETLAWVEREMTAPDGGFYASLDADSEGHEGKFYVWPYAALRDALGDDAALLVEYWGASADGNFEGQNILWCPRRDAEFAAARGVEPHALRDAIRRGRATLVALRDARVRPARDEKIIAGWNGLMLRGVAECARVFSEPRWRRLAERAGEFLATSLVRDGRARRIFADGASPVPGVLEDHAALGLGFLSLYEMSFDARWLDQAQQMATACERHFWDERAKSFYDTADDAPPLVTRPHDAFDNAVPSGASLAADLLQRLAALDGDQARAGRVRTMLAALAEMMDRVPMAFGHLLGVANTEVEGAVSVVLAGATTAPEFQRLAQTVAAHYLPGLVLGVGPVSGLSLLQDKMPLDGAATAYLCRGFTCDAPTTDPDGLARQLAARVARVTRVAH